MESIVSTFTGRQNTEQQMPYNVYKIYFLNDANIIKTIIVFRGDSSVEPDKLFSKDELDSKEFQEAEVIYSNMLIHKDDSIQIIKNKIMRSLSNTLSYDEIYLFSYVRKKVSMTEIYQAITQDDTRTMTNEDLQQFYANYITDDSVLSNPAIKSVFEKDEISYDDLLNFESTEEMTIPIPLGTKFEKYTEPLFSVSPFTIRKEVQYQKDNTPFLMENSLLLNYGQIVNNAIYLCIPSNILNYLHRDGADVALGDTISEKYIFQCYFPLLYNRGIYNSADYEKERDAILEEERKRGTIEGARKRDELVDVFYSVYEKRIRELPYTDRGIRAFSVLLQTRQKDFMFATSKEKPREFPLEMIFKNIHCNANILMIKYNPASRKENIYRFYTEKTDIHGSKIPFLDKKKILSFSKEYGRSKEIAILVRYPSTEKDTQIDFVLVFNKEGNIRIDAKLTRALLKADMDTFIRDKIAPILSFLQSSLEFVGITIPIWKSMGDSFVEVLNIEYISEVVIQDMNSMNGIRNLCIDPIIDVYPTIEGAGIESGYNMLFKRVENFKKMNGQNRLLTHMIQHKMKESDIIEELKKKYQMSVEDAIARIENYISDNQYEQIRGKIIDNPGFEIEMKLIRSYNDIRVLFEVSSINSFLYLDILSIYIDSIIRILQYPETTGFDLQQIRDTCLPMTRQPAPKRGKPVTAQRAPVSISQSVEEESLMPNIIAVGFTEPKKQALEIVRDEQKEPSEFITKDAETEVVEEEGEEPSIFEYEEELEGAKEDEESDDSILEYYEDESDGEDEGEAKKEEEKENLLEVSESSSASVEPNMLVEESSSTETSVEPTMLEESSSTEDETKTGGAKGKNIEDEDNETEEYDEALFRDKSYLDGMKLTHFKDKYFTSRLFKREPKIFLKRKREGYNAYSSICQSSSFKQPIILTDEEKQIIDREHPNSYENAIHYGSDPNEKFWYICPRYWCLLTNSSISEEDVKSGKCGNVIPKGAKTIPKGSYVFEFTEDTYHTDIHGNYIQHHPGFLDIDKHPEGLGIPCCFNNFNSKLQRDRRNHFLTDKTEKPTKEVKQADKNKNYIVSNEKYPLEKNRWGFLPLAVQSFLKTDNNLCVAKNAPALIKSNTSCVLRFGVEKSLNKSFIAVIADLYAHQNKLTEIPSIEKMCAIIAESVTLDNFIQFQNGNLTRTFSKHSVEASTDDIDIEPYKETKFVKKLELSDPSQMNFLKSTIRALLNFRDFMTNKKSTIDYTYLWDFLCSDESPLIKGGLNLVLLEITDDDTRQNIELICPSNAYSNKLYDANKGTAIVIKHDIYYEPVYFYQKQGEEIIKIFHQRSMADRLKNIQYVFRMIDRITNQYCSPKQSLPEIYEFRQNEIVERIVSTLTQKGYQIDMQVLNYQPKVIGLIVHRNNSNEKIFVPTLPSAALTDIPEIFMDDTTIWRDYETTKRLLNEISQRTNKRVLCRPLYKIVEDEVVIGILTETNQFVQINPPLQNTIEDELIVIRNSNYLLADKTISTGSVSTDEDTNDRLAVSKKIALDNHFYLAYRDIIRHWLNTFEYRKTKRAITDTIDTEKTLLYSDKMRIIENEIRTMITKENSVIFQDIDEKALLQFAEITACYREDATANPDAKKFCFVVTNSEGKRQIILPKVNLINGRDNESFYKSKIADEILRYSRIRLFMFSPKSYFPISSVEYKVSQSELLLLEMNLTEEFFNVEQIPLNKDVITREEAYPKNTKTYISKIPLTEQYNKVYDKKDKFLKEVLEPQIERTTDIKGNMNSFWKQKVFPKRKNGRETEEVEFHKSVRANYFVLIKLMYDKYSLEYTVEDVKGIIARGYKEVIEQNENYKQAFMKIWKKQGKSRWVDAIERDEVSVETVVYSDEYFLSNIDLWVFAKTSNVPLILFSAYDIDLLGNKTDKRECWLVLQKTNVRDNTYYFIRSPSIRVEKAKTLKIESYHLISPDFHINELQEFETMLKDAYTKEMYSDNVISLEKYLDAIVAQNA